MIVMYGTTTMTRAQSVYERVLERESHCGARLPAARRHGQPEQSGFELSSFQAVLVHGSAHFVDRRRPRGVQQLLLISHEPFPQFPHRRRTSARLGAVGVEMGLGVEKVRIDQAGEQEAHEELSRQIIFQSEVRQGYAARRYEVFYGIGRPAGSRCRWGLRSLFALGLQPPPETLRISQPSVMSLNDQSGQITQTIQGQLGTCGLVVGASARPWLAFVLHGDVSLKAGMKTFPRRARDLRRLAASVAPNASANLPASSDAAFR